VSRKSKIPFRNRNQTGWWIFCEVEQWVSNRQKRLSPKSRCLVWENMRLLRARNREEAYRKSLKFGRMGHPSKTNDGKWHFVGISMLFPVFEEIEDGAEILWRDWGLMSVKQIKHLVKTKQQLPIFNDKEEH
jgi:hypothetical protein